MIEGHWSFKKGYHAVSPGDRVVVYQVGKRERRYGVVTKKWFEPYVYGVVQIELDWPHGTKSINESFRGWRFHKSA